MPKNGMFEAIINHESEQIRPLDNAYTDILNKAVKIRSTRANQLAELAHQRTRTGGMFMIGAFVLATGHDADNIYGATSDRHSSTATCRTTD